MKTVPFDITRPDLSLAMGLRLTLKDETEMGFTNHDRDAVIDGVTYKARTGFFRNALTAQNKLNVANMDVIGFLDSTAITEVDLRAGRYQDARVHLFLYDWSNPTGGIVKMPGSGWLGTIKLQDPIGWTATLLGMMQAFQANQGALYSNDCRNDLGDHFCHVDLAPFTQDGEVLAITTDNYAFRATATADPFNTTTRLDVPTWKSNHRYYPGDAMRIGSDLTYFYVAVQANSFSGGNVPVSGSAAPSPATAEGDFIVDDDIVWQATLHDWYFDGRVLWRTGANVLYPGTIARYTVGTPSMFELQSPTPLPIVIGDTFSITAGCSKLFYECQAKFANQLNFNGENLAPGQEAYLDYPDNESA